MNEQVIPAEAVEAAVKAYRAKVEWIDRHSRDDYGREDAIGMVAALEAAAPYMQGEAREMALIARERKRKLEAVTSIAVRLGASMQGDDRELSEELYAAMGLT